MEAQNSDQELVRTRFQVLSEAVNSRFTLDEVKLINDAYGFAQTAHQGQRRRSGEPYIIHPIEVALIIAVELGLDAQCVCAGLLHDVVEDNTNYNIGDIVNRFGQEIGFLVDVVTKRKDKNTLSKQVENYHQILESVQYDVRALLIKLADRLHNMRTLDAMTPHKKMKIAAETAYFYAPLANRLGLYKVKTELENLSFFFRCKRAHLAMLEAIRALEAKEKPVVETLISKMNGILQENGIDAKIEVEYRQPFNILRKMHKSNMDFNHVEGKRFFRVVYPYDPQKGKLFEKEMAMKIYTVLSDKIKEKPQSLINYINSPKDNGYQSLHVKLLNSIGQWEEIHISSERMRRVSRLGLIADRQENNITRWLNKFKDILKDVAEISDGIGFMDGVERSFYNDDMVVYTPNGDLIILPQGSTVLDFAFEIHTQIGLKAKYAHVNGKLVNILTPLQRGDLVEVGTSEDSHPEPFWLDHVKTYKAIKFITEYLSALPKKTEVRCPHCCPIPEDEVTMIEDDNGIPTIHRRDCPIAIRESSQQGDNIKDFELKADDTLYPVELHILAVDRIHLLAELIECITNELKLPIGSVNTNTKINISQIQLRFGVHSYAELHKVIESLNQIPGVDEVWEKTRPSDSE